MKTKVSDHRTQIYLPDHLYKQVKLASKAKNISMARFIRMTLEDELAVKTSKKSQAKQAYLSSVKNRKKYPRDFSTNFNQYLSNMWREK